MCINVSLSLSLLLWLLAANRSSSLPPWLLVVLRGSSRLSVELQSCGLVVLPGGASSEEDYGGATEIIAFIAFISFISFIS